MTWINQPYIPGWWPGGSYPAQQGWQCPCCRRVYSPTTAMCFTCGSTTVTSGSETVKNVGGDSK